MNYELVSSLFSDTVLHCLWYIVATGSLESHCDERDGKLPLEIRQMLLVLQNVHRSPPSEDYFALQRLVGMVVKSYLPMVARSRTSVKPTPSQDGEYTLRLPLKLDIST